MAQAKARSGLDWVSENREINYKKNDDFQTKMFDPPPD